MPRRVASRWNTKFARWVSDYGVDKLRKALALNNAPVTSHAIYDWLSGYSLPHSTKMLVLENLSGGRVTNRVIHAHRSAVLSQARGTPPASSAPASLPTAGKSPSPQAS